METTTIRLPEELIEKIDDRLGADDSRADWIRAACRSRVDQPELEQRVEALEEWRESVEATPSFWERIRPRTGGYFGLDPR